MDINSSERIKQKQPNCISCNYYYVTWDVKFPCGCKLFKVKSKQTPALIVYESIGKQCEWYTQKKIKS